MMYDLVFVVLVYRNSQDLMDFFHSLSIPNSKVIVVNSYYDENSEKRFQKIAQDSGADFISVPNKGYGAGNNKGIEYALSHYDFKYLIISNADVIIETLDVSSVEKYGNVIIAPKIINLSGKKQNPSAPFSPGKLSLYAWKYIYTKNLRFLVLPMSAWSRLKKILYYVINPFQEFVFSAHGAFVIIPEKIVRQLHPLFNEEMFLMVEEEHLGMKAKSQGIKTRYVPDIVIRHKEDGSMKMASLNNFETRKQSFLVYYNYWFAKNKQVEKTGIRL